MKCQTAGPDTTAPLAVSIIFENRFFLVPAGGYVIYGAGIFNAEGTRHGQRLAEKTAIVKLQDLTL